MSEEIVRPGTQRAPMTAREEFSARQVSTQHETAAIAAAAHEKHLIESRFIIARQNPRDVDRIRHQLIATCRRPGFAATARYRKPAGRERDGSERFVEGPSISFVVEALRLWGNMLIETPEIYDDERRRKKNARVVDLETNNSYEAEVSISKTVERSSVRDGQMVAGPPKINSKGKPVYTVVASDDELLNKENALLSKATRNCGLRHLPRDLVDECMDTVLQTQRHEAASAPELVKQKLVEAFKSIEVTEADLIGFLHHGLDGLTPAEVTELRGIYSAISEGEATWAKWASASEAKKPETPSKTGTAT